MATGKAGAGEKCGKARTGEFLSPMTTTATNIELASSFFLTANNCSLLSDVPI
jgi:hypothetical protein